MKRVLVFLLFGAASVLLLCVVAVVGADAAWKRAGRVSWPAGLGPIEKVPAGFPKRATSADALRLAELAKPLGIDFGRRSSATSPADEAIKTFVAAESQRAVAAIGAPPEAVVAHMTRHAGAIDAVRDHLRGSRDLAWAVDVEQPWDAPQPVLPAHLQTARLLVARALVRARNGDPGAWDDLHAASTLDRSLQSRPDVVSQVIALAIAQQVNAAAWKLPLPAPAWLAEDSAVDRRRLLLRGLQYDTWTMWRFARDNGWPRPYVRASLANLVRHERKTALDVSRVTACGFDSKAYGERRAEAIPRWNTLARIASVSLPWSRVLRYEAEREATANALRVRAGQPLQERSRCSDGAWRFENGQLAFTAALPPPAASSMPLRLQVGK